MGMARMWRDEGRRQQAYDLLAPVCGWFSEGFDTPDLQEAKALLDGLKGDERKMPLAVDRMGRGPAKDEPPKRDW